jgi:hypothetical protein
MTFPKFFLDLKSEYPERRYWHFSGTRYTLVVILEGFIQTIYTVQINDGIFLKPYIYDMGGVPQKTPSLIWTVYYTSSSWRLRRPSDRRITALHSIMTF